MSNEVTAARKDRRIGWSGVLGRLLAIAILLPLVFVASPLSTPAEAQIVPAAEISVSDATADESAAALIFTMTRSGNVALSVIVDYQTLDGTAHEGVDYVPQRSSVTFLPSETSKTVTVVVVNDTIWEKNNETMTLQLLTTTPGPPLAKPVDGLGVGTIIDNDIPVSIGDASLIEGTTGAPGEMEFPVTLPEPTNRNVTVTFSTVPGGSANPGTDFTPVNTQVVIPAGQTRVTATVPVLPDNVDEPNETFHVALSGPVNAAVSDGLGIGTIIDDDGAPSISVQDTSVIEGTGGSRQAEFSITVSSASAFPISVTYTTSDGTARSTQDYAASTGKATIPPGQTQTVVAVPVITDSVDERHETFFLSITNPVSATVGDGTGQATIIDDDKALVFIGDSTVTEPSSGIVTATFNVTLSTQSDRLINVHLVTKNGSATAGEDYTARAQWMHFLPGQTSGQLNVTITADDLDENTETFFVTATSITNSKSLGRIGTGTILDNADDSAPTVSIDDAVKVEGTGGTSGMNFPLRLSKPSGRTVTVNFSTDNGTAAPGSDYKQITGTATFASGQTQTVATVQIIGDKFDEFEENFSVHITATNASVKDGGAVGTIVDDDLAPAIRVSDDYVTEGNSGTKLATFNVTLTAASAKTISVNYSTSNGTALSGSDYLAASGTLVFTSGETSKTVSVSVLGDTVDESSENFFLNLSDSSQATIADGQGRATITDND